MFAVTIDEAYYMVSNFNCFRKPTLFTMVLLVIYQELENRRTVIVIVTTDEIAWSYRSLYLCIMIDDPCIPPSSSHNTPHIQSKPLNKHLGKWLNPSTIFRSPICSPIFLRSKHWSKSRLTLTYVWSISIILFDAKKPLLSKIFAQSLWNWF